MTGSAQRARLPLTLPQAPRLPGPGPLGLLWLMDSEECYMYHPQAGVEEPGAPVALLSSP